ncbi:hypothetical protein ABT56_22085 [Photobacterium aquae]|uniref:diguanylate cyclase n=1 Tax=Photobacterium aquae TaxID=1195763 RepID=A0A0J1JHN1_9GAMM|nr:GGDEF domain-containing protein [Photobacterium aquae]KLV01452.1 hypothetical protein ABT56_22085 [Photobacterium aquae]
MHALQYFRQAWSSAHHATSFHIARSLYLSARINILSALWGSIVILWLPADLILLPLDVCERVVVFRVLFGLVLLIIFNISRRSATLKSALQTLYLLILSINLFFICVMWALNLPGQNISIPYGYYLLPVAHIALLSIFPLTIKEAGTLVLITLIASATPFCGIFLIPHSQSSYWFLLMVATAIMMIQLSKLHLMMVMHRQAALDPLTSIYNRGQFLTLAQRVFERCKKDNSPFAIMLIDIDKFKQVNDTWGHSAGDNVLQAFSEFIQNHLRATNLFGRYGGEEFVICIPYTSPEYISLIAERLLNGLAELDITISPLGENINVTASIGISYSEPGDTLFSLIERADVGLYRCKNSGRNCYKIEPLSHSTSEINVIGQVR